MSKLGKYEVLSELATGSMGVLYRARDTMLDREVALRTIAGAASLDPELKDRFYREARAGARLQHPNIVTIYDLGEQDGMVFIALELLTGCDLRQFIGQRRRLSAPAKVAHIASVCDGLGYAHQFGITHRDIKPSNIFLTDEGVPKILDFGVARLSASTPTATGRLLGAPLYLAPEQIMGEPCDARSDQFSLAVLAFEFLAFAHPFAGDYVPKRITTDKPDSLLAYVPDLPEELETILNRALAKDPAGRYQKIEEFAHALRGVFHESLDTLSQIVPVPSRRVSQSYAQDLSQTDADTESKMTAILLALQEFDAAIERRDVFNARTALDAVERLSKMDERFSTVARESRARLQELQSNLAPTPPAPPAPAPRAQPPTPPVPPAAPPVAQPPTPPAPLDPQARTIIEPPPMPKPATPPAPPQSSATPRPPVATTPPPPAPRSAPLDPQARTVIEPPPMPKPATPPAPPQSSATPRPPVATTPPPPAPRSAPLDPQARTVIEPPPMSKPATPPAPLQSSATPRPPVATTPPPPAPRSAPLDPQARTVIEPPPMPKPAKPATAAQPPVGTTPTPAAPPPPPAVRSSPLDHLARTVIEPPPMPKPPARSFDKTEPAMFETKPRTDSGVRPALTSPPPAVPKFSAPEPAARPRASAPPPDRGAGSNSVDEITLLFNSPEPTTTPKPAALPSTPSKPAGAAPETGPIPLSEPAPGGLWPAPKPASREPAKLPDRPVPPQFAPPPPPPPPAPAPIPPADSWTVPGPAASWQHPAAMPMPVPPPAAIPPAAPKSSKVLILVLTTAVILLGGLGVGVWFYLERKPIEQLPAQAAAQVASPQASIFKGPDFREVIVTLRQGDTVNVIRPPKAKTQEWTEVQFVGAKPLLPGSIHTRDLASWSSNQPVTALYLLELFAPADGSGEAALRQYAQQLTAFLQRFAGTPQEADARTELDRINTLIARLTAPPPNPADALLPPAGVTGAPANQTAPATATGQPPPAAERPRAGVPATAPNPTAPAATTPAATAPPPKPVQMLSPETSLARAQELWENGDYAQAERLLRRILQQKPDFPAARELLNKVLKAKQLESPQ